MPVRCKAPVLSFALASLASLPTVVLADASAGKATFSQVCSECHEAGDFDGDSPQSIAETLKQIVAGQKKHKPELSLSEQQIADVAAYMAAGGK